VIRLIAIAAIVIAAQNADVLYDEARVPAYTLPDPLVLNNGERVRDVKTWTNRRRAEILEVYRTNVFGRDPGKPRGLSFKVDSIDKSAFDGRAVRKQVTIAVTREAMTRELHLMIHLPAAKRPTPIFLALSFTPNEAVLKASQWPIETILARGYGLATMFYGDIEPDKVDGMRDGVRALFLKPGQDAPAPDEWGALAAWAWGLSRAMDYVETDRDIDAKHVAVLGHSRLGKATLWAAAQDPRFALVISNESGEGGAAIARRQFGERTKNLNDRFPHWFAGNFKQFNDREERLPVDAHMLLALNAPRPLYVASAEEDRWADPKGEFLAAVHASPVYELFRKKGIGTTEMPAVQQPVGETVRYHIRSGKHDVTAYDWEQYLAFADKHWRERASGSGLQASGTDRP
jgi:hypothetical protein